MPIIGLTTEVSAPTSASDLYDRLLQNIARRRQDRDDEAERAAVRELHLHDHAVKLLRAAGVSPETHHAQWGGSDDGRRLALVVTPVGFRWRLGVEPQIGTPQVGRVAPLLLLRLVASAEASAEADAPTVAYTVWAQRGPVGLLEQINGPAAGEALGADRARVLAWLRDELTNPDRFWDAAQLRDLAARRRRIEVWRVRWAWYDVNPPESEEV